MITMFDLDFFRGDVMGLRCIDPFKELYEKSTENGWNIGETNYYYVIKSSTPEIFVDDDGVEVRYEENSENSYKKGYYYLSFPENSLPETVHAEKKGEKVILTLEMKEKPKKRRKLEY